MNLHHELITPNLRTTSRLVAEKFGKRHDNVLRDVERIRSETPPEFSHLIFEAATYLDAQGKPRQMVELTRDGFVLLAMGFTGAAAMEWKIRFIEAFNMMAAELAGQAGRLSAQAGPVPEEIASLSVMEKLSICRELRLLAGESAALAKWNWIMPPALAVSVQPDLPRYGIEDGRACLRHILAFDTGRGTVAQALAGSDGPAWDAMRATGLALRWNSHLFVARQPDPRLFAGTAWDGGRHLDALLTIPGANEVPDRRRPGVIVPLPGLTGTVIPLRPEET